MNNQNEEALSTISAAMEDVKQMRSLLLQITELKHYQAATVPGERGSINAMIDGCDAKLKGLLIIQNISLNP